MHRIGAWVCENSKFSRFILPTLPAERACPSLMHRIGAWVCENSKFSRYIFPTLPAERKSGPERDIILADRMR